MRFGCIKEIKDKINKRCVRHVSLCAIAAAVIVSLILGACSSPDGETPSDNESNTERGKKYESVVSENESDFSVNINGAEFGAKLCDNSSARAFADILPLSLDMKELNGNEKYYYLDGTLPSEPEKIEKVSKGDIMLYGDNCIVVFYESFSTSYSYTRLGYIEDPDGLEKAAGGSDAKVTISKIGQKQERSFDPYSSENNYDLSDEILKKQDGTDYGTIDENVEYYSQTAGDYKQCNVLLPPNYDESGEYPVMYVIHGWGGSHTDQIHEDSYLQLVYGNMLREGLTVPMIIVNADMYTDKLSEKENKTNEELREIYDMVIDDISIDLMPFVEKKYPVKTGRTNTAVAGVSQGASEALATGFKWLDKIGYIGSFAPDPGVIPTEFYKGTYWNTPIFDEFPIPNKENTPEYLYLSVGSKDPWNIDVTLYYSEVLDSKGIKNQTDYVEGYEHNYEFWRLCFYNFLSKIFK